MNRQFDIPTLLSVVESKVEDFPAILIVSNVSTVAMSPLTQSRILKGKYYSRHLYTML